MSFRWMTSTDLLRYCSFFCGDFEILSLWQSIHQVDLYNQIPVNEFESTQQLCLVVGFLKELL